MKSMTGMPSNQGTFFGSPIGQLMLQQILQTSLAGSHGAPTQQTTDMMAQGRPSYNWDLMGGVAPLAGFVPQPEYSTPPPSADMQYWRDLDLGSSGSTG